MTIRLTPKQYKTLAKMAWLSERLAVGSELQESETVSQILALSKLIYEKAGDFDAGDMFPAPGDARPAGPRIGADSRQNDKNETDGNAGISEGTRFTEAIESELFGILEWYEEYSFWDLLEDRLAMRDVSDDRTEAQWNWLPDSEKDRIYYKHLDFYYEEFAENGVMNLRLVAPDPDKPRIPYGWSEEGSAEPAARDTEEPDRPASPRGRQGKIIEFPGSPKAPPKKPRE
jgi:hypothetical protein